MIIGVSGKARSGKNVFAEVLAEELHRRTGKAFVMMAYADELKNMAQKELDLSWDQLWGDEKEAEDKRYKKIPRHGYDGFHETGDLKEPYWTGREIMQSLGEFFRGFDRDFWVKKLFRTIEEKEYENVIITDVRYPNEVDPVVEREGYHVRVSRPDANQIHGKTHESEVSLDAPYKVDFTVLNVGTLDDLRKLASDIASGITQLEGLKGGMTHG
jgi:hypothetical protein